MVLTLKVLSPTLSHEKHASFSGFNIVYGVTDKDGWRQIKTDVFPSCIHSTYIIHVQIPWQVSKTAPKYLFSKTRPKHLFNLTDDLEGFFDQLFVMRFGPPFIKMSISKTKHRGWWKKKCFLEIRHQSWRGNNFEFFLSSLRRRSQVSEADWLTTN